MTSEKRVDPKGHPVVIQLWMKFDKNQSVVHQQIDMTNFPKLLNLETLHKDGGEIPLYDIH